MTPRRIPYGTLGAAESTLDEFYRQLAAAERRHAAAQARVASFDASNPDHWELIDEAGDDTDAASDQVSEIEREIDRLEREMGYGRAAA